MEGELGVCLPLAVPPEVLQLEVSQSHRGGLQLPGGPTATRVSSQQPCLLCSQKRNTPSNLCPASLLCPATVAAEELREEATCCICLDFSCALVTLDCRQNLCQGCIALSWARASARRPSLATRSGPAGHWATPRRTWSGWASPGGDEGRLLGHVHALFLTVASCW